jgi:hypothetical protein
VQRSSKALITETNWKQLFYSTCIIGKSGLFASHRQLRLQRFVEVTLEDLQERKRKSDAAAVAAAGADQQLLPRERLEAFFSRLADDAGRRRERRCSELWDR